MFFDERAEARAVACRALARNAAAELLENLQFFRK
jgi:hypothetical protein